jgi:hypothetical protein
MVDEKGGVLQRGPQPTAPATVTPAKPTGVVDGAIASATMPGIFPARRLGNHMCVDGGVRDVIPVQEAVQDLGCNEVIAIRCSAPPAVQNTDPTRPVGEVMSRNVLDITFDEIAANDTDPFSGWGDGVSVTTIGPSMNLHDPMVVEPGLIRIGMDYGWMQAAESLDVPESDRRYAMELSERITLLRAQNWKLAFYAAGLRWEDPHRSFSDLILAGTPPNAASQLRPVPDPAAVDLVRTNCLQIRDHLEQRLLISAPTQPSAARTAWFTQWERIFVPSVTQQPSGTPWDAFHSRLGDRPAVPAPAPI